MKINLKVLYNLNIRERLIIAGVILVLVGYLIYGLVMPPVLFHHKTARRQLYVQRHLIESKEEKTKKLLGLEKDFKDLQRRMAGGKLRFFTEEEATEFLRSLEGWATETKNNLEKIRPQSREVIASSNLGETEELCYKKDIVEVIVRGRYNNLLSLFRRIADYEKLLGATQVEIKPTREDPSQLSAKFILNIYILGRGKLTKEIGKR